MEKEFNLREACNRFNQSLTSEIGEAISLKFSIDVQLPAVLWGEPQLVFEPIKLVILFFKSQLKESLVVIEILRSTQQGQNITLKINLLGFGKQLLPKISTKSERRLLNLPVAISKNLSRDMAPVSFEVHHDHYLFSFKITFSSSLDDWKEINSLKHKKVLLLEYNDVSAMVFCSFLKEWGVEVTHAKNAEKAINWFNSKKFDLVFIDLYLPNSKSSEAIYEIAKLDTAIPIVALTHSLIQTEGYLTRLDGVKDFLERPVNSSQLKNMLIKYLG